MSQQELHDYAQRNGWVINGPFGNWVNYNDMQQRITNKKCEYIGKLHEIIVGFNKQIDLVGMHILHYKDKARQDRGLEREYRQYRIEAEKVKNQILEAEKQDGF